MSKVKHIIASIKHSTKSVSEHLYYPINPGIYSFVLAGNSTLKLFGRGGQIIYIGIAKDSLKKRDLNTHFKIGRTGHSTLRRSIGAILKQELALIALSRNGTTAQVAIDNYKFQPDGEERLSEWMKNNLRIGYWEDHDKVPYGILRELEEDVIKELKPTLDLDNRTRRFNPLESALDELRGICKREAIQNTKLNFL